MEDGRVDQFHALAFFDPPNEAVCDAVNRLYCSGAYVEIWTGRTDDKREQTLAWLRRAVVRFDKLRMRPFGDFGSVEMLTAKWCRELHRLPDMAWDDRTRALDQWSDMGVQPVAVGLNEF